MGNPLEVWFSTAGGYLIKKQTKKIPPKHECFLNSECLLPTNKKKVAFIVYLNLEHLTSKSQLQLMKGI